MSKESLHYLVSARRVKLSNVGTVAFLKKRCCRIGGGEGDETFGFKGVDMVSRYLCKKIIKLAFGALAR